MIYFFLFFKSFAVLYNTLYVSRSSSPVPYVGLWFFLNFFPFLNKPISLPQNLKFQNNYCFITSTLRKTSIKKLELTCPESVLRHYPSIFSPGKIAFFVNIIKRVWVLFPSYTRCFFDTGWHFRFPYTFFTFLFRFSLRMLYAHAFFNIMFLSLFFSDHLFHIILILYYLKQRFLYKINRQW